LKEVALMRRFVFLAVVALVMAVVLVSPTQAATPFTVINTNDSGAGSLRQAILDANGAAGEDTINFQPSLSPATITLGSQLPAITDSAGLIIGGGSAKITVSGDNKYRVFEVGSSAKLTLNKLTVANGNAVEGGGGIINLGGTVTVTNSTLSGNSSSSGGGGIYNNGMLTLSNSTLSGNSASGGGGIWNNGGTLTLSNSTLSGNSSSPGDSGSILNNNTATLKNTIVSGGSCLIVGGTPGTFNDGGYNLDSGTSCGFTTEKNSLSSTDPMLGPLADNGGPTKTHALLEGSPAIDKGVEVAGITTDQRGVARPQGAAPDIGAFEVDTTKPTVIVQPAAGATLVPRGTNVVATFSEKMEGSTLTNPRNFKLYKRTATGSYIQITDVTLTTNLAGTKATLNPFGDSATRLSRNTRYKAEVTTGVKDLSGNAMAANQVWTFKTVS
jgi:hypothetical protein